MPNQTCPYCEVGVLHPRHAPYVRVIGGTLLQVPHSPAWQCDVCRTVFFDPAHEQMITVLAGEAGPPPNRHHTASDHAHAADDSGATADKQHARPK